MTRQQHIASAFEEVARDVAWLRKNAQQQSGSSLSARARARSLAPVILDTAERVSAVSPVSRHGMSVMGNFMEVGIDHVKQSISDILTTPLNSRVMRREYGSELPDLIDQPMNPRGKMRLYAATAGAIRRWEPRVTLLKMILDGTNLITGRLKMTLIWRLKDEYHWMLPFHDNDVINQEVVWL